MPPAPATWLSRLLHFATRATRDAPQDVVFPADFLASLERLRLVALKAIGGGLREGHRLGAYKGGQLEFHGHRGYTPGDELCYVDWNTYARLGKPYVKEFAREEAGVLHLLLDATPSMSLGAPSKWTFARRVAALFAHVALASKDAAFVYLFRDALTPGPSPKGRGEMSAGAIEQFPRRGAKAGTREFLAFLEGAPLSEFPRHPTPVARHADGALQAGVTGFLRTGPARGRVIIISDFWAEEREVAAAVSRLASSGFDGAAIHVLAPEELLPQAEGELLARSIEEDGEVELSAGSDLPERYARELELHRAAVEDLFRRRGGNYLLAPSDSSIERVLVNTLRQRRWVS